MGHGVAEVGFWRQERALRIGGDWGGWALGGDADRRGGAGAGFSGVFQSLEQSESEPSCESALK